MNDRIKDGRRVAFSCKVGKSIIATGTVATSVDGTVGEDGTLIVSHESDPSETVVTLDIVRVTSRGGRRVSIVLNLLKPLLGSSLRKST